MHPGSAEGQAGHSPVSDQRMGQVARRHGGVLLDPVYSLAAWQAAERLAASGAVPGVAMLHSGQPRPARPGAALPRRLLGRTIVRSCTLVEVRLCTLLTLRLYVVQRLWCWTSCCDHLCLLQ